MMALIGIALIACGFGGNYCTGRRDAMCWSLVADAVGWAGVIVLIVAIRP